MENHSENRIDLTLGTTIIQLRGQLVRLQYHVGGNEPEVFDGDRFIDNYWLEDRKTGERLNWDLNDTEDEQVRNLIFATENYEIDKAKGFDPEPPEDEDEPRRSWSRRNPTAPTGTGRI